MVGSIRQNGREVDQRCEGLGRIHGKSIVETDRCVLLETFVLISRFLLLCVGGEVSKVRKARQVGRRPRFVARTYRGRKGSSEQMCDYVDINLHPIKKADQKGMSSINPPSSSSSVVAPNKNYVSE